MWLGKSSSTWFQRVYQRRPTREPALPALHEIHRIHAVPHGAQKNISIRGVPQHHGNLVEMLFSKCWWYMMEPYPYGILWYSGTHWWCIKLCFSHIHLFWVGAFQHIPAAKPHHAYFILFLFPRDLLLIKSQMTMFKTPNGIWHHAFQIPKDHVYPCLSLSCTSMCKLHFLVLAILSRSRHAIRGMVCLWSAIPYREPLFLCAYRILSMPIDGLMTTEKYREIIWSYYNDRP